LRAQLQGAHVRATDTQESLGEVAVQGIARKVPEIDKGLIVTFGIGKTQFEKLGPAPVSMPNNNFLTANPLFDKSGQSATLGMTWVF